MNTDNKPIIRKLTLCSLKAGKSRNIIAILAIALTAVLFTSVFTFSGSILNAIQDETMRQVGTQSHGGLKNLTMEQYEHFSKSPLIKDISFNIFLAIAENDPLKEEQCEIRYSENKAAKWYFSYPRIGKMPKTDNELACSTIVLDALDIPHEIGATVPLMFSVGGSRYAEQFTLSGYWEGDLAAYAQQIWLSHDYIRSVISENVIPSFDNAGKIYADVWFSNSFDISGKMQRLIIERGYGRDEIAYGVNWAYATNKIDPLMIAIVTFFIAMIMLSGYLIIYSIFAISVNADIRFFGLLKTIGATGKQIRRVVRGQALILSILGIPIGLIIGYIIGTCSVPLVTQLASFDAVETKVNPSIFLVSALCVLLTVLLSCRKPSRMASKVSSVEAVKYSGIAADSKRKAKGGGKITPLTLAWVNITREKKKLCIVILSLSLSLILLNSVFSASQSFDMDEYLSQSIISDFAVADYSVFSASTPHIFAGVTEKFLREAEARGAAEISKIYYFEKTEKNGTISQQIYSIGKMELESFSGFDYEKLRSGNYLIVSNKVFGSVSVPSVGDRVKMMNTDGESREFEVLAVIDEYPLNLSSRFIIHNSLTCILANDVFLDFFGEHQPMQANLNAAPGKVAEIEAWMNEYATRIEPNLDFISRGTLKGEFERLQMAYVVLGGFLAFVLALIGVLNFTNAIVASILARRREFAILQSIGMTGKQLKRTLIFEGSGYTVLTAMFTVTVGLGLTYLITLLIAGQVWFFRQNITILPSVICLPLLLALCAAIPVICCSKLSSESLVERLRVE